MNDDRDDYDPNELEHSMLDIEDRLVGDFLCLYPMIEVFLNTAYDWEDERVNNHQISYERLSHKDISITIFLAESLKQRISHLMSDPLGS